MYRQKDCQVQVMLFMYIYCNWNYTGWDISKLYNSLRGDLYALCMLANNIIINKLSCYCFIKQNYQCGVFILCVLALALIVIWYDLVYYIIWCMIWYIITNSIKYKCSCAIRWYGFSSFVVVIINLLMLCTCQWSFQSI